MKVVFRDPQGKIFYADGSKAIEYLHTYANGILAAEIDLKKVDEKKLGRSMKDIMKNYNEEEKEE